MAMLSYALLVALVASSANAFAPVVRSSVKPTTLLKASEIWDPLGLYELGTGKSFDTFPTMFPEKQYLEAAEIKHGRQAMLAWTGVWATTQVRSCLDTITFEGVKLVLLGDHRFRIDGLPSSVMEFA
jgi:Chlorophyll A-B binding protein